MPGEPLADDILPNSFPMSFGDPHLINRIKQTMDAEILFSRHLRVVLKQGYGDQMTDERINKVLANCWMMLSQEGKHVYESLVKDKKYLEDVRGVREHNHKRSKNGMITGLPEMDAFGSNIAKQ